MRRTRVGARSHSLYPLVARDPVRVTRREITVPGMHAAHGCPLTVCAGIPAIDARAGVAQNPLVALRVLGPVDVDGQQLSPRERTVLAALAISIPYGASAPTLADALWGESMPTTWPKQLQAIVGLLRRSIGAETIETIANGYALAMDADSLDASRFERLIATARSHTVADDPERAAVSYRRALALWRGTPYAELAEWQPATAEISRLQAVRATAEEELLASRLACGEHRAAIPEAERLVRDSPYREERWALLALANYQSGRQAEALAALRSARRTLVDDLGIEPGEQLSDLETAILRHDPLLAPTRHEPRISESCPYRGLSAYGPDDADDFFGRDAEIQTIVDNLSRRRFLALTGASGSGKSSLALAGVVPMLKARGWTVEIVRPGMAQSVLDADDRRLVVIDQFEELFALGLSEAETEDFGELLESYLHGSRCLLITVRSDFLDRCAAVPALARLIAEGVYVVGPLSATELRRAIEGPAAHAGLRLEAGLAELVIHDSRGASAALPLLSHALVETWLRREGSVLTVAGYEASGGISGAIAQSAEDLFATLSPEDQAICRSLMLRLVSRGPDGSAMRRRAASAPLVEDRERRDVLARLTRARLITAQEDSIVVAHEAIASAWPRLGQWLDEDAEGARLAQQLTSASEQWAEAGMPDSDLYRGARLAAVEQWTTHARPRLTSDERAFIEASGRAADTERRASEDRAAHDRRSNRRLRVALAAAAVLLVGSLAATGVAVAGNAAATAAQTDASIEALLGTSLALRSSSRDVSALLAAEMWHQWPDDPRSRAALMGVFTASGGLVQTSYLDSDWLAGEAIPGTTSMIVNRGGSALEVRDVTSGEVTAAYASPAADDQLAPQVTVSADATTAAAVVRHAVPGSVLWSIDVFDAHTLRPLRTPVWIDDRPSDIALSRDGRLVAVIGADDATLFVADLFTGAIRRSAPQQIPTPEGSDRASLSFAADGRLALGTVLPELRLFDPDDLSAPVDVIPVPAYSANSDSAVTGDGLLLAGGERSRVAVDPGSRRVVWQHALESSKPTSCVLITGSSSSGTGYCSDTYGGTVEFDLATGYPTGRRFDTQLGRPSAIALFDDGAILVIVGDSTPTLSVFRTDGGGAISRLGAPGHVMGDPYNSTGDALVIAERPPEARYDLDLGTFSIWSPTTDETLLTMASSLQGVGWAGTSLLSGWDTRTRSFEFFDGRGNQIEGGPIPADGYRTWVSPSGARMYLAVSDGESGSREYFATYDGATGKRIEPTFDLGESQPQWISSSSDDSVVAITRWVDGEAITGVFDARTGKVIIDGLKGPWITAITPDRAQLIAADEGRITRYRLDTLEQIGTIPGARGEVNGLQIDAAGVTLFATSNDQTVSLYDLATGLRLGDPIPASAPQIGEGALNPNGREFVVNVNNGVQVWDAVPAHQFEAACRIAGRELTDEEWATYLPWLGARHDICTAALR